MIKFCIFIFILHLFVSHSEKNRVIPGGLIKNVELYCYEATFLDLKQLNKNILSGRYL